MTGDLLKASNPVAAAQEWAASFGLPAADGDTFWRVNCCSLLTALAMGTAVSAPALPLRRVLSRLADCPDIPTLLRQDAATCHDKDIAAVLTREANRHEQRGDNEAAALVTLIRSWTQPYSDGATPTEEAVSAHQGHPELAEVDTPEGVRRAVEWLFSQIVDELGQGVLVRNRRLLVELALKEAVEGLAGKAPSYRTLRGLTVRSPFKDEPDFFRHALAYARNQEQFPNGIWA